MLYLYLLYDYYTFTIHELDFMSVLPRQFLQQCLKKKKARLRNKTLLYVQPTKNKKKKKPDRVNNTTFILYTVWSLKWFSYTPFSCFLRAADIQWSMAHKLAVCSNHLYRKHCLVSFVPIMTSSLVSRMASCNERY